jgi:NhaA family Na+:H+ antiporter
MNSKSSDEPLSLTELFREFVTSEKSGGIVLILCAIISLFLANSRYQIGYISLWHHQYAGLSVENWINDGLMAVFFFLIGLELKREILIGELSNFKIASLPILAAIGGMAFPAALYLLFNFGTSTQSGAGIPIATDIAFALGLLSLLGRRVPVSLKIFLTALAVIDDLGAIIVIAVFYTANISIVYTGFALAVICLLLWFNHLHVSSFIPYLLGGCLLWYCMLHSGIHATISGVLLALTFPFGNGRERSPSHRMQHLLHKPVAFIILPLFALANTSVFMESNWYANLLQPHSLGILAGLIAGKPLGIILFSLAAVKSGLCALPQKVMWRHMLGLGFLGGIGFTMSIFITLLSFTEATVIDQAKIAVLLASLLSGILGYFFLRATIDKK